MFAELKFEISELAHEMVRLEQWSKDAYDRRLWAQVGEMAKQREEVQLRRSELMRDLWVQRGGRRPREALRQA